MKFNPMARGIKPRMVERADGRIVTMYYWASPGLPEQQIAATIWDPDELYEIE